MSEETGRRTLYPEFDAYGDGTLDVGGGHQLYYEESGNPHGKPVVFLHGGPGAGCTPAMRRFFNPDVYRVVLFDQRGCGRSTPHASLENNTTWDLVNDIEILRCALQIDRWQVFGGSWGSTLALAYAQTHPERVTELVLRGIFLMRSHEIDWLYKKGTSELFPDHWEKFIAPVTRHEQADLVRAYYDLLMSDDESTRIKAAKAWAIWEASTISLLPDENIVKAFGSAKMALAVARIECHYFVNAGFMEEGQLLRDVDTIRQIPAVLVHGRYDALCPVSTAWDLARAWPEATLKVVPDAGHTAFEPGNVHELVMATDGFATY